MGSTADSEASKVEAALWREHALQWARSLNRRAEVEQELLDAARGKRPLPSHEELRSWAVKLGVPEELRSAAGSSIGPSAPHVIISNSLAGRVRFSRSDATAQDCVCCPRGTGHIFSRRLEIENPGDGPLQNIGDLIYTTALRDIAHEGKRVRITVEVLADDGPESPQVL